MPTDVPLACSCGKLRGLARDVAPHTGLHLVCYCDDCQAAAHALERGDAILDAYGGTRVFQLSPARIVLSEGHEHLACLRLTPKGLMRWYAGCCRTPIANTLPKARVPFAGLVHTILDPEGVHASDLGPIRARVNARFATGEPAPGELEPPLHPGAPPKLLLRFMRMLAGAWIRGEHRPSPFFDDTGTPRVEPRVFGS